MNYQPLFDVMSQHGLTLLEGEMEEIIRAVNEGQGTPTDTNKYDPALYWVMGNHGDVPPQVTPKQKKLTYTEIRTLYLRHSNLDSLYNALLPYLADEQPELKVCTGCGHKSTDPINKKHLACCPDSNYITLDDYLINSIYRPLARTQFTALGSTTLNPPTKPEPSRLEVAAMILANNLHIGTSQALRDADELIKQAKG